LIAGSQQVWIRVSDKGLGITGSGNFSLVLSVVAPPPSNDDCSTPNVLAGLGVLPVDNTGATTGTQGQAEPLCILVGGTPIRQDVWYTWVSPRNGAVELTTCGLLAPGGGSQDTKIAVYDGAGCPTAAAIACNDDDPGACGGFASKLTFNAVCGNTYTFQFGMYQGTALFYQGGLSIASTAPGCDTPSTPVCLGDGTQAACPCLNSGAAGHGCASPAFASGAILTSSGIASDETVSGPSADTLVLTATNIPGPGLFFQSNALVATPINFGDGHLCAAVGLVRLGVVFSAGGVASYPGGLTPNEIHIQGGALAGQTKFYQCWYRSLPNLCNNPTNPNSNLTQGLSLVWQN